MRSNRSKTRNRSEKTVRGIFRRMPVPGISSAQQSLRYLRQFHSWSPSQAYTNFLIPYQNGGASSQEVFNRAVLNFAHIANLTPEERERFFGTQYAGIHYSNDLADALVKNRDSQVKPHELSRLCPNQWDYPIDDGRMCLLYKGNRPSQALDKLLQGPTVIDCGMFTQLALWFGIRGTLGDKKFDQLFGKSPLYITQLCYHPVPSSHEPNKGNPLWAFISADSQSPTDIRISHIANHMLYQVKHAGGAYGGENCLQIGDKFTIFDPSLQKTTSLELGDIQNLLLDALNAPQNGHDKIKYALLKELDAQEVHPVTGMTYGGHLEQYEQLAGFTLSLDEWLVQNESCLRHSVCFDFKKFKDWCDLRLSQQIAMKNTYDPLSEAALLVSAEQRSVLPHENRERINFTTFREETTQQSQMKSLSLRFCSLVMQGISTGLVLTGKAGIGKSASAVNCYLELMSRGKKVLWISEVTMRAWTDKAKSIADLEKAAVVVNEMLASNPDVVVMDDNNLIGYSGKILLELIYNWYVANSGKGLLITSNEDISLSDCYGLKLDEKYYFAPFMDYGSAAHYNFFVVQGLDGPSLRPKNILDIDSYDDSTKLKALVSCKAGQSVGILVNEACYLQQKHCLPALEYVPDLCEHSVLPALRCEMKYGNRGPVYASLTLTQRSWLSINYQSGGRISFCHGKTVTSKPQWLVNQKKFAGSSQQVIALEIRTTESAYFGKNINHLEQILRVLNYAHDNGGKKIIFINCSDVTGFELLQMIEKAMPEKERERSMARLKNLLYTPALAESAQEISALSTPDVQMTREIDKTPVVCRVKKP